MAITITIDNDTSTTSIIDKLVLDESSGLQTQGTADKGNDSNLDFADPTGGNPDGDVFDGTISGASFSASFLSFLNAATIFGHGGLRLADAQKAHAAHVEGAVSSSDFVKVTVTNNETISDLYFSDSTGHALNGDQVVGMQTLDGSNVYLWSDGDYCIATTSSTEGAGRVVAAFYLNEDTTNHLTAQIQMVTFEPLKHPDGTNADDSLDFTDVLNVSASGTVSFNFDNLNSGNFLWAAVGSSSAGLLVTGQDLNVVDTGGKLGDMVKGGSDPSDSVNTSQGGIGATIGINSQHFADISGSGGTRLDGATAVCTLVTGFAPLNNASQATGLNVNQIDYANYVNAPSAKIFISQTTGSSSLGATMKISLWEAGGGDGGIADHATDDLTPEEKYGTGRNAYIGNDDTDQNTKDDWAVAVGQVTVTRGATTYTFTGSGSTQGGITVSISGNVITLSGIVTSDTIGFAAADDPANPLDGTFNRFDIQALANTNPFDIGRIDLDQGVSISHGVGSDLVVQDDGPSLTNVAYVGHVDEDAMTGAPGSDLSTGIVDNPDDGDGIPGEQDEITITQADLSVTVNSGTDSPGLFSLVSSIAAGTAVKTTAGDNVYSMGDQLFWRVASGVLQGVVNAGLGTERVVFTITVNDQGTATKTDDTFTFDLKDQLDHSNGAGELANLLLNITPAFQATDADGDPVDFSGSNLIRMQVENDTPTFTAQIADGTVAFADDSSGSVTKNLNGAVGGDDNNALHKSSTGVLQYTITSWDTPHDVYADLNAKLSDDGATLTYYSDLADTNAVYQLTLNQTANSGAGSYTFTVLKPPPNTEINLDFTDLPSGQNLLGVIAFDKTNVVGGVLPDGGLLVFPSNPVLNPDGTFTNTSGTINTSKGGGPVTIGNGNQAFDHNYEGAFFCYVDNPTAGSVGGVGLTQTSADDADTTQFEGTVEATRASVEIVQASGKGTTARPGPGMQITAYDIDPQTVGHLGDAGVDTDSDNFITDPTATGQQVKIISVKILDSGGNVVEFRTNDDAGATNGGTLAGGSSNSPVGISFVLDNANGAGTADDDYSVQVTNLKAGYTVEFVTQDAHDLALVQNLSGSYDIGGFNIFNQTDVPAQDFNFQVQINDYDNDSFSSSLSQFSVHINDVTF